MNQEILDIIINECVLMIQESPKGQKLYATYGQLVAIAKKELGISRASDFEQLLGESITLYAQRMFAMGLALGRNPEAVLDVPDSPYLKRGEEAARSEILNAIINAAETKANSGPKYDEWYARYEALENSLNGQKVEDYFDIVWQGISLNGEAMFLMGWELRGNPTRIFDLPTPS